jgi:hypothetical protein
MAGHWSNWIRPTTGKFAGKATYIAKSQANKIIGMDVSHMAPDVRQRLVENRLRYVGRIHNPTIDAAEAAANTLRPGKAIKPGPPKISVVPPNVADRNFRPDVKPSLDIRLNQFADPGDVNKANLKGVQLSGDEQMDLYMCRGITESARRTLHGLARVGTQNVIMQLPNRRYDRYGIEKDDGGEMPIPTRAGVIVDGNRWQNKIDPADLHNLARNGFIRFIEDPKIPGYDTTSKRYARIEFYTVGRRRLELMRKYGE